MIRKNQHFAALCKQVSDFLKTDNETFASAFYSLYFRKHRFMAILAQSYTMSGFKEAKEEFSLEPVKKCM